MNGLRLFFIHHYPLNNCLSLSFARSFISIKVSDLRGHYNKQQNTAATEAWRKLPSKMFSFPFQRRQTFLPARRETVIKFHELLAPVNVRGVKSKFKLCTKSDPIPLYLDGWVQGPLIPDEGKKRKGKEGATFFGR